MKRVVFILVIVFLVSGYSFAQDIDQKILETRANIGNLSIQEKQAQNQLTQIQQAYNQSIQQLRSLLEQQQQEAIKASEDLLKAQEKIETDTEIKDITDTEIETK